VNNHIDGDWESREVYMDGKFLSPFQSKKAYNHSPDGFNWGYCGSGPAQLALAVLMKLTDTQTALRLHQKFKFEIIAKLPQCDFELDLDIQEWIDQKKAEFNL
jgi:hypothetical protein